jgi:hypothetical protein
MSMDWALNNAIKRADTEAFREIMEAQKKWRLEQGDDASGIGDPYEGLVADHVRKHVRDAARDVSGIQSGTFSLRFFLIKRWIFKGTCLDQIENGRCLLTEILCSIPREDLSKKPRPTCPSRIKELQRQKKERQTLRSMEEREINEWQGQLEVWNGKVKFSAFQFFEFESWICFRWFISP